MANQEKNPSRNNSLAADPRLIEFARQMRREPTPAEEVLWRLLRNRRFVGLKFRRQHP
jgi:very-short-patch-repair endonuclease